MVPLGLAIHGASVRASTGYSFLFGFLGWIGSAKGLIIGLSAYSELPIVQALLLIVGLSAFAAFPYGLFGFLYGSFRWMDHAMGPLRAAACLTLLVSAMPAPLTVGPAHALYVFPMFIQHLDLGGEPLLLFGLCLVNWLFVDIVLSVQRRARLTMAVVALCSVLAIMATYGWLRLRQYEHGELQANPIRLITIATIQPNTPLPTQLGTSFDVGEDPKTLLVRMSAETLDTTPHVNLLVWPETSTTIYCAEAADDRGQVVALVRRYDVPLLLNCAQRLASGNVQNTALLISKGRAPAAYHKQRLAPFAEYLPGEQLFPQIRKLVPGAASVVPGHESVVFRIRGLYALAPIVCYEVLFSDQVNTFVQEGGNVLINQTNDAWFGSSRIPEFLVASAVYRATEYRVPLVRSSNSGNSLLVGATGEILSGSRTGKFTRATLVRKAFIPLERSVYARLGNSFFYLMLLLWLVDLLYTGRKHRILAAGCTLRSACTDCRSNNPRQ